MRGGKKSEAFKAIGLKLILSFIVIIIGALIGIAVSLFINGELEKHPDIKTPALFIYLLAFVFLILAILAQIIFHEVGHLVFGLLTGYRFGLFRVGDFLLIRSEGKIRFKRHRQNMVIGQCLMFPPEQADGKIPYLFYNLGGVIFNFILALAAGLAILFLKTGLYFSLFCACLTLSGIFLTLTNGLPLKALANDAFNITEIKKDPEGLSAFWRQLKIYELLIGGKRLKEMPEDLFEMRGASPEENVMTCHIEVFACDRLMDSLRFSEAEVRLEDLLSRVKDLNPLAESLLEADLIFCYLVNQSGEEQLQELWEDLEASGARLKGELSVIRTNFAYYLLREKNQRKADEVFRQFQNAAKNTPFSSVVESEREKIEYVKKRFGSET